MTTKEKLFEVALELFSKKGFNATSIRAITSKAGVAVASFYNHFKSKEELLDQMYEFYTKQYIANNVTKSSEEMLYTLGPVKHFEFLGETIAQSMQNENLVRLSRIIMMEQYLNSTAREITMKDKKMLLDSIEKLFITMQDNGMINVNNASVIGKIIGYAYLGFASDDANFSIIDGCDPTARIKKQTKLITDYLKSILTENFR